MRKRWVFFAGTIGAGLIVRWQLSRWFTEKADYVVEERIGELEIRRYPERVIAETDVDERDWDHALNEGFRRLAGYIFGGNHIAMTTPVGATKSRSGSTISFTMPSARTLESLPAPNDSRVALKRVAPVRVAALRFRGRYNSHNVEDAFKRLRTLVRQAGLHATGEPQFAGYDPPTTLPLLRRNEVWVGLASV